LASQLAGRIGQKVSLCVVALPQILSWLFIYYAKTPFYLIVSRVLGGFAGGGLYSIIPSYISEISDNEVRGTLGSSLVFSCNLGIFLSYVCGEYLDYFTVPWVMIPGNYIL
jgi:MFS family permease